MELIRHHATNGRLMGMAKPAPSNNVPADRVSPHTSDSEMSAVESLTGMKRGRLGHAGAAAGRPRRSLTAADVHAANNNSGTTGSLKTNSSGCALTAALEGAAAAARRSPPRSRPAAMQVDLARAPGSAESLEASVAGPPLSTAQQHALVNRILVSMGHAPLTSSTLAAIMAKTGPKSGSSPPQSPSLLDPSVRGGSAFVMDQLALEGRRLSGDGAAPSRKSCHDLERLPCQQVCGFFQPAPCVSCVLCRPQPMQQAICLRLLNAAGLLSSCWTRRLHIASSRQPSAQASALHRCMAWVCCRSGTSLQL